VTTSILIVERAGSFRARLASSLADAGWAVTEVCGAADIGAAYQRCRPDVALIAELPDCPWSSIADLLTREASGRLPIVLLAHGSCEALAVTALRAGVDDYVPVPCGPADVLEAVSRVASRAGPRKRRETHPADIAEWASPLIGQSVPICAIGSYIRKLGQTDCNVLITGETGTGKELVAELIHAQSARRSRPFLSVNCAAVPDTLLESELFGYERGAFTDAHASTEGKLESANGGTVFLDEIGDMTVAGQAKMLRVTGSKELYRLGGKRRIEVDVRVLAATNQDLDALMADGRFRRDLYFRLNVARVELPPLRERLDDLPLLVSHYVRDCNRRFGRSVEGLTDDALDMLRHYEWPGNVRELKNVVEAIFVNQPSAWIGPYDLPSALRQHLAKAAELPAQERDRLLAALIATHWNKSRAAEQLRWSRMTLYRKMAKYGVPHDVA
jgi:DNA-binding NtrC family response regulator